MNVPFRKLTLQERFGTMPIQSYRSATKMYPVYHTPAPVVRLEGETPSTPLTPGITPEVTTPRAQRNSTRNFVIGVSIVIVLGGVVYYFYQQRKKKKEKNAI